MIDVLVVGGIYREQLVRPHRRTRLGGSGLYAAVAAASLGASTALVAAIGCDDADKLESILQQAGVDSTAVDITTGSSATFVIEDEGEVQAPDVQFEDADSPPVLIRDPPRAGIVLVFGMPDLDPFASGLIARWVDPQSTLIWDRQGSLSQTKDAVPACGVAARSRIYLANVGEAAHEVGGATPSELLENHPIPGFDYALLKNGRWGTTLLGGQEQTAIPAFRVAAATTVGSGDVFAGALAAGLARGEEIDTAATRAAAAAAVAISEDSPLLDGSVRRKVDRMLVSGHRRYVDPVHVGATAVVVEAGPEAELQQVASDVRARLRGLGLRDGDAAPGARTIGVVLRPDERGVVADVSSLTGWSRRIAMGVDRDLEDLIDAIADCLEATQ